jgi:hypothetical protein
MNRCGNPDASSVVVLIGVSVDWPGASTRGHMDGFNRPFLFRLARQSQRRCSFLRSDVLYNHQTWTNLDLLATARVAEGALLLRQQLQRTCSRRKQLASSTSMTIARDAQRPLN